jgi:hypothetical protein
MRTSRLLSLLVAGLTLSWAGGARAHPGYPEVVKTTLDLSAIYDPSGMGTGCSLCHINPEGMGALRPFGSTLVQTFGLSSDMVDEEDSSLVNALQAMGASSDARLIADIKSDVDPNTDPELIASALPTPEYGCVAAPGNSNPGTGVVLGGLVLMGLGARRRRAA